MKKTELEASIEAMNKRFMTAIGEMSHVNWVVLKKELGMTKEEILNDEGLIKVFTVWSEGDRTPEALQGLLEVSDRELTNRLGVDYDALIASAVAEVKGDADK